jgi:hypothetical protein
MGLVGVFAILLLFIAVCVVIIFFVGERYGWKKTLQFLFFSIAGRIVTHFALSNDDQTEQTFIALLGAGLIVYLLPHVVRHKGLEKSETLNSSEHREQSNTD